MGYHVTQPTIRIIHIHTYTRKHSQHNNDERNTVLKKNIPLTLYSKGLRKGYVWKVSWRLNKDCNILTPSSSGYSSTSFLSRGAAQLGGGLRAHLSARSGSHCLELQQLTPNSKLTRTSCGTGLYNCSVSVASAHNSTRPQSRLFPDIFDRMHLLFTQVHFLFDSLAGSEVNMLHYMSCSLLRLNFCCFHQLPYLPLL